MIVIIDYNVGNLKSVTGAFKRIGLEAIVSRDEKVIREAKGIVLPGVGTFPTAMKNLERFHLVSLLKERKEAGIPILGICLGMQILFEKGYEVEETKGLGFIPGYVSYMDIDEKIPHMGWNSLNIKPQARLFDGIANNSYVYFVHSYYLKAEDANIVAASTEYSTHIHASVESGNIFACQFHPEKSSDVGLRILKNFASL